MTDCIFCKIIRGELPSYKIYEDKFVYAFLDIMPVNKGHVLVVSREHYEDFLNTPEDILCKIITATKKITPAILRGVGATSFNVGVNNGSIAGQIVPHLHFHIMPRFSDDRHHLFIGGAYNEGEAEMVQKDIVKFLGKTG